MLIDSLTFTLEKSGCLDAFWGKLDAGEDGTLGVASSARPFLVAARFAHRPQPTLVVVAGEDAAVAFSRSLAAYLGDERVMRFPERSDYPFVPKPSDPAQVARRMEAVHALASGREVVVVASARALVRALPPAGSDVHVPVALSAGRELAAMPGAQAASVTEFEDFAHALEERGYRNTGELDGPGTFAVRGGTIDVFPGNLVYPVRLDFFGDELEEIRRIVPTTGQTIQALPDVSIYPVVEFSCSKRGLARARQKLERPAATNPVLRDVLEKLDGGLRFDGSDMLLPYLYATTSTLGDYVRPGALSVLLEPRSLFDDMSHAYDDAAGRAKGSSIPVDGLYAEPGAVSFGEGQRATYVSIMRVGGHVDDELPVKRVEVAGHPDKLFGRLRSLVDTDYTVVFSASNFRARQDMKLAFVDHGLPIQETLDAEEDADELEGIAKRRLRRGVVNVVDVDVPLGMIIPKAKLAIVSLSDTQGASTSRPSRHVDITEITFPYQPGDYVVHAAHGVAYFKELVRRDVDGTARDYLLLEYSEGDKLYVPVEQLDRVTRYVGPEGASPRLTRLNTADWSRALAKARKATKKLAFDLVDVYARRASVQGYRFGPDTAAQREMEEAFPYQETPDQLAAIADVKADMQSAKPMDRLVCGDVGFGKTEVAIRAAFKAAVDGKQVAVLVPTTILALQHYRSFSERLRDFPVRVEYLNRTKTAKEAGQIRADLESGRIDILIGTHKILGKQIKFRDLGLLIIDEEQKFGVAAKEKLTQMAVNVDTLTLTATPIPRTLQFSLMGSRDLSVISTPPPNRQPIVTESHVFSEEIIRDAVEAELARGGQVYFVHNRVEDLMSIQGLITRVCPKARVAVGHGKMPAEKLEKLIMDFIYGEFDVLVSTTIIENGIDIPNANTIIVDNAQNFGLSDLHQLRGRVGRSNQKAYCYLLSPPEEMLSSDARRRLRAIEEFSDLGSGFNIAMQDLDIRGAGNLLGAEQSGFIADIGFETYQKIMNEAIAELRAEGLQVAGLGAAEQDVVEQMHYVDDAHIEIEVEAGLPDAYVAQQAERLKLYRELDSTKDEAALQAFESRLADRFGPLPREAQELLNVVRLRWEAIRLGIERVKVKNGLMILHFVGEQNSPYYKSDTFMELLRKVTQNPARFVLKQHNNRLAMTVRNVKDIEDGYKTLQQL